MGQPNGSDFAVGKLVVASVFDVKSKVFFQPYFARTRAEALRSFLKAVNQEGHIFNDYPEDFTLFVLASWDEEKGGFTNVMTPESLGNGLEYVDREPVPSVTSQPPIDG